MPTPDMPWVIETRALSHRFAGRPALDAVSLEVPSGSVYGFLGPNGSGKTTTIRILLGLLKPQAGEVRVLGLEMPKERRAVARGVGAMVETPCLYDHLTGYENLELTRRVLSLPKEETSRALDLVDLQRDAQRRVGGYSLGMRQRLAIARAMLGRPRLLVLDEPTNGLDPEGVRDMRGLITGLPARDGVTVFVSSHILSEIEQMGTHIGLILDGKLIAQCPLPDLYRDAPQTIEVEVRDAAKAVGALARMGVSASLRNEGALSVDARDCAPEKLNATLVKDGFAVSSLVRRKPTLEDIFLSKTKRGEVAC